MSGDPQKYYAALVTAINNAISNHPNDNLKRGMTEEVEVGRSSEVLEPLVTLYAKQKDTEADFTADLEKKKEELGNFEHHLLTVPSDGVHKENTAGYELRFVHVVPDNDDNGGTGSTYSYGGGKQGSAGTGGREYRPLSY
ncbi:hypothetical protein PG997_002749 [Apiospora hydei]|uniref:Uncharacterized protein n=1 Tax=Apiospora hydei TaxID=1337664 RepID=A0ABR1WX94_9PEZI